MSESKSVKKYPFYYYLLLIIIPVLFFVFLETGLRMFNYGHDFTQFVPLDKNDDEWLIINPELPYKYFANTTLPPAVIPDAFRRVKPDSAFRVFVLGGSSAAGWPFGLSATFPKYIKRFLKTIYPDWNIEVINLGMSAVNSYTVLDLAEGVIEQKPDLILIYAGHNEYYGALGVGSTQSFGTNPGLVRFILGLRKFRTIQLIQNIISSVKSLFAHSGEERGTLMARMIGSGIKYKSDLYYKGIEQFKRNMNEVLSLFKQHNIPVIIGNLTENLEQKPFLPEKLPDGRNAKSVFKEGLELKNSGDTLRAKELLVIAKEYDALRFRAPSAINAVIDTLAAKFNIPEVNVDSAFSTNSPGCITGYNLMVDHLHPTREGYRLLGKTFFTCIMKNGFVPADVKVNLERVHEFVKHSTPFTELDSVIADIKMRLLLGSYPFAPMNAPNNLIAEFTEKNLIDSLASQVYFKDVGWQKAHLRLAEKYYSEKKYVSFLREIDAVLDDRPFNEYIYYQTAKNLIHVKKYKYALRYLYPLNKLHPNDYSTKWIGNIAVFFGNNKEAIKYLNQSLKFNDKDPQVYYNLAGAYFNSKELDKAVEMLGKCLAIAPKYTGAREFYDRLNKVNSKTK